MKESDFRKWHRNLGILLALFLILQAGTGLLITIRHFSIPHSHAHGNDPGHEKSREAEKPIFQEPGVHEATPLQDETSEEEKSIHHESPAHDHNAGHTESNEQERPIWIETIEGIHHGGGGIGTVYRLLVGIGMLWMAASGSMIFFKIQARTKKG